MAGAIGHPLHPTELIPYPRTVTTDIVDPDAGRHISRGTVFLVTSNTSSEKNLVSKHHGDSGQNSQCKAVWCVVAPGMWPPEMSHEWPRGPWGAN